MRNTRARGRARRRVFRARRGPCTRVLDGHAYRLRILTLRAPPSRATTSSPPQPDRHRIDLRGDAAFVDIANLALANPALVFDGGL